jgi:hypothetical protein
MTISPVKSEDLNHDACRLLMRYLFEDEAQSMSTILLHSIPRYDDNDEGEEVSNYQFDCFLQAINQELGNSSSVSASNSRKKFETDDSGRNIGVFSHLSQQFVGIVWTSAYGLSYVAYGLWHVARALTTPIYVTAVLLLTLGGAAFVGSLLSGPYPSAGASGAPADHAPTSPQISTREVAVVRTASPHALAADLDGRNVTSPPSGRPNVASVTEDRRNKKGPSKKKADNAFGSPPTKHCAATMVDPCLPEPNDIPSRMEEQRPITALDWHPP